MMCAGPGRRFGPDGIPSKPWLRPFSSTGAPAARFCRCGVTSPGNSETGRPLEPAGFDFQFTGTASRDHLSDDLRDYLTRAGLPPRAAGAAARVTEALALVTSDPGFIMNGSRFKSVRLEDQAAVLIAHQALGEEAWPAAPFRRSRDGRAGFLDPVPESSAAFLEEAWHVQVEALESAALDWAAGLRDRQMADNLIWMTARAYPTRKIIVWAATSHLIRHRNYFMNMYDPKISDGRLDRQGDRSGGLYDRLHRLPGPVGDGRDGGARGSGSCGTEQPGTGLCSPRDSNSPCRISGIPHPAAPGSREPLSCRPMGSKPMITDWTRILDGIFFIREMVPSVRIDFYRLKD